MIRYEVQPPIAGLMLIQCKPFPDSRGFFMETYRQEALAKLGLPRDFVQDNQSHSLPGVLRGLHFQCAPEEQGKLVHVVRGRIWDVAVDLRPGSPTFGKYFGYELNDKNGLMYWMPKGFAHGFCVLGDEPADVAYKIDGYFSPKNDTGVRWNDPDLAIQWPIQEPIVSQKDMDLPLLRELFPR